ncbi:MAG: nucleotidyltransferase domain-containing protein [Thermodesulfobacteriota bacterium]|nr:nucleotidyltransferase domain-containing protein [Thermodesulfobacteriota bacterium]
MKKELKEKLKGLGIYIVYLFGSTTTGRRSVLSDVDVGVVLKDPPIGKDTRALYHNLYGIFSEIYAVSKLDIVFLQAAPVSFQFFAIKEGKVLFEEDPAFTADYENLVINQYLDFRHVLDLFDRVTIGKYAEA